MRNFVTALVIVVSAPVHGQNIARSFIQGAWSGQESVVKSALASGRIDVNLHTPDGETALMLASLAGHEGVVGILLEADADPDLANENGETALILASKYGFTAVAAQLIEAGTDVTAEDSWGRAAWTWAKWGENERLQSLLEASGAKATASVDPFAQGGPIDRFEKAPKLKKGQAPKISNDLRESGVMGKIMLRLVVDREGKVESVELLEGLHDELDREVLEEARKWRFDPGEIQSKPVVGSVRASIDYPGGGPREGHVLTWSTRWRN